MMKMCKEIKMCLVSVISATEKTKKRTHGWKLGYIQGKTFTSFVYKFKYPIGKWIDVPIQTILDNQERQYLGGCHLYKTRDSARRLKTCIPFIFVVKVLVEQITFEDELKSSHFHINPKPSVTQMLNYKGNQFCANRVKVLDPRRKK